MLSVVVLQEIFPFNLVNRSENILSKSYFKQLSLRVQIGQKETLLLGVVQPFFNSREQCTWCTPYWKCVMCCLISYLSLWFCYRTRVDSFVSSSKITRRWTSILGIPILGSRPGVASLAVRLKTVYPSLSITGSGTGVALSFSKENNFNFKNVFQNSVPGLPVSGSNPGVALFIISLKTVYPSKIKYSTYPLRRGRIYFV